MIHLTIVSAEGGAGDTPTPAGSPTSANSADFGTQPKAYKISVERQLVADMTAGPYIARYEQNWFYAEKVGLTVNEDGLLTTVSTTSSDRTGQIISNIADTAINVAKFEAATASVKSLSEGISQPPQYRRIRYKRLNIDVTFDPFDPPQRNNVLALFRQVVIEDDTFGNTIYISPLLLSIQTAVSRGVALRDKLNVKSKGLWFRETTPVELIFQQNPEAFRQEARGPLKDLEKAAARISADAKDAVARKTAATVVAKKANNDAAELVTAFKAANEAEKKNLAPALAKAQAEAERLATAQTDAENDAAEQQTKDKAAQAALADLRAALHAAPTISRSTTFVKSLPNPNRIFSFNIARSAFVQSKKIDLTISNGLLTSVNIDKGSEVEGFSAIPLDISKKLASLPKDILTVRTENVTAKQALTDAQKNAFNSQAGLDDTIAVRKAKEKQARIQAETEEINAETARVEAQKKLDKARSDGQ